VTVEAEAEIAAATVVDAVVGAVGEAATRILDFGRARMMVSRDCGQYSTAPRLNCYAQTVRPTSSRATLSATLALSVSTLPCKLRITGVRP
jgi:hypothetical protein